MQPLQNLWPQLVCTGSRSPKRQIGHSYLLSNGGSKYSSYPSDLGSSYDEKFANKLTVLGSNELSRKSDDCSSRRKERVITARHFLMCFLTAPHFSLLNCLENETRCKLSGGFPVSRDALSSARGFFPCGSTQVAVMVCCFQRWWMALFSGTQISLFSCVTQAVPLVSPLHGFPWISMDFYKKKAKRNWKILK